MAKIESWNSAEKYWFVSHRGQTYIMYPNAIKGIVKADIEQGLAGRELVSDSLEIRASQGDEKNCVITTAHLALGKQSFVVTAWQTPGAYEAKEENGLRFYSPVSETSGKGSLRLFKGSAVYVKEGQVFNLEAVDVTRQGQVTASNKVDLRFLSSPKPGIILGLAPQNAADGFYYYDGEQWLPVTLAQVMYDIEGATRIALVDSNNKTLTWSRHWGLYKFADRDPNSTLPVVQEVTLHKVIDKLPKAFDELVLNLTVEDIIEHSKPSNHIYVLTAQGLGKIEIRIGSVNNSDYESIFGSESLTGYAPTRLLFQFEETTYLYSIEDGGLITDPVLFHLLMLVDPKAAEAIKRKVAYQAAMAERQAQQAERLQTQAAAAAQAKVAKGTDRRKQLQENATALKNQLSNVVNDEAFESASPVLRKSVNDLIEVDLLADDLRTDPVRGRPGLSLASWIVRADKALTAWNDHLATLKN